MTNVTEKNSFESLDSWIQTIKSEQNNINNFIVILLGNKCDLKKQKEISNNEIIEKNFEYPYFEVSAKKGTNVIKAFEEMIDLILKDKNKNEIMEKYGKKYIKLNNNRKDKSKVICC